MSILTQKIMITYQWKLLYICIIYIQINDQNYEAFHGISGEILTIYQNTCIHFLHWSTDQMYRNKQ